MGELVAHEVNSSQKAWYVVHTYSGQENKVKVNLEKRVKATDMENKIFNVLVPTEEKIEIKKGQKKTAHKKIFPGYVLVEMIMGEDSWYIVRNTPGVTGFVSAGTKPVPLREDEIQDIMKEMGIGKPKVDIGFSPGQNVRVIGGPFADMIGVVDNILPEKGKVKVKISMFGRETPIELEYNQIEEV